MALSAFVSVEGDLRTILGPLDFPEAVCTTVLPSKLAAISTKKPSDADLGKADPFTGPMSASDLVLEMQKRLVCGVHSCQRHGTLVRGTALHGRLRAHEGTGLDLLKFGRRHGPQRAFVLLRNSRLAAGSTRLCCAKCRRFAGRVRDALLRSAVGSPELPLDGEDLNLYIRRSISEPRHPETASAWGVFTDGQFARSLQELALGTVFLWQLIIASCRIQHP
jgi:hypothetical protein